MSSLTTSVFANGRRKFARCFCGFTSSDPWYQAHAWNHAEETNHIVEILDEETEEVVFGCVPEN